MPSSQFSLEDFWLYKYLMCCLRVHCNKKPESKTLQELIKIQKNIAREEQRNQKITNKMANINPNLLINI